MAKTLAGYSGTPLVQKLGIKEGFRCALINAPENFERELKSLPDNALFMKRPGNGLDFILTFSQSEKRLQRDFAKLAKRIKPTGMIWVAWPKKGSAVPTDLTFNVVQRIGLRTGLVDVKICAINEIWSGLKFMIRLKDRA